MFKLIVISVFVVACCYIQVCLSGSDSYFELSTISSTSSNADSIVESQRSLQDVTTTEPQLAESTTATINLNMCNKCSDVFYFRQEPSGCSCKLENVSIRRREYWHPDRNLHGCCEDDKDNQEDADDRISEGGWEIQWQTIVG
ncbi:hypothetical protein ACKWTF_015510 [Chironomus riparius]